MHFSPTSKLGYLYFKTVSEAMERLLIERSSEEDNVDVTHPVALVNAAKNCNRVD